MNALSAKPWASRQPKKDKTDDTSCSQNIPAGDTIERPARDRKSGVRLNLLAEAQEAAVDVAVEAALTAQMYGASKDRIIAYIAARIPAGRR